MEGMAQQAMFGFRYIWEHRPLFHLQMLYFFGNLVTSLCFPVIPALILARTGNNATVLGSVESALAAGSVAGGVLLTIWGGPKRKVDGVLVGQLASSLGGFLIFGIARSLPLWAGSAVIGAATSIILNGSSQAIWQAKVPPALQGRVFSVRRLIAQVTVPIATLAAGPLADKVFGPAMMPTGSLAPVFGWLTGTGPGTGISLMCVLSGLIGGAIGIAGYLDRRIRNIDSLVPDFDTSAT
jgi:hypothetical protein